MKRVVKNYLLSIIFFSWTFDTINQTVDNVGKTHFILQGNQLLVPPKKPTSQTLPLNHQCLVHEGCIKHALFSAYDDIQKTLIDLINKEQKSIKIAIYSFTDKEIAQALITAHHKGINVQIVCDCSCLQTKFSKIALLAQQGIKTYIYSPIQENIFINDLMHHKFVLFEKNIFDKPLLWTGSFNFTKSANNKNQENVIIMDDIYLIKLYQNHFNKLVLQLAKPKRNIMKVGLKQTTRARRKTQKKILT
ncbi:MAG: phospholipase D-like domain-containing protein [Candidatus Dependentiae bacterium]